MYSKAFGMGLVETPDKVVEEEQKIMESIAQRSEHIMRLRKEIRHIVEEDVTFRRVHFSTVNPLRIKRYKAELGVFANDAMYALSTVVDRVLADVQNNLETPITVVFMEDALTYSPVGRGAQPVSLHSKKEKLLSVLRDAGVKVVCTPGEWEDYYQSLQGARVASRVFCVDPKAYLNFYRWQQTFKGQNVRAWIIQHCEDDLYHQRKAYDEAVASGKPYKGIQVSPIKIQNTDS